MRTFWNISLSAPEMNNIIVGNLDVLCVISPEDNRSVLWKCLFHFIPPIHLKLSIILKSLCGHECLNGWSQVPTGSKNLITTQVNVRCVSEQVVNFLVNLLGKLVDCSF